MTLLRFLRFPNLMIIALTQYLLHYAIILPVSLSTMAVPALEGFHFFLLVLTTIVIAAGGYVINDIVDYEMDLLNKPEKVFINRWISRKNAWLLYVVLSLLGFAMALYLAVYVKNLLLVLIFPAAVALLAWYSFQLKKLPLVGNVVVSLFCAFVAGVVLFAERKTFAWLAEINPTAARYIGQLFGGYLLFAFFSTMVREIVKDMEDVQGDLASNCRTLPIAFGVNTAKWWAFSFALILLALVLIFAIWLFEKQEWAGFAFSLAGIVLPLVLLLLRLKSAQIKPDFARLSQLSKTLMVAGVFLLVVIWIF